MKKTYTIGHIPASAIIFLLTTIINGSLCSRWQWECKDGFRQKTPCIMISTECEMKNVDAAKLINPCDVKNGGCSHVCGNQPFGIKCQCRPGWRLAHDKKNCVDVDECSRKSRCADRSVCENLPGSYICRCQQDRNMIAVKYPLLGGRVRYNIRCLARHWCRMQCDHYCDIGVAPFRCDCFDGFKMYGGKCIPTCKLDNGGCQHYCRDSLYGPVCECKPGQKLDVDRKSCISDTHPSGDGITETTKAIKCKYLNHVHSASLTAVILYNTDQMGLRGNACISFEVRAGSKQINGKYRLDGIENPPYVALLDTFMMKQSMIKQRIITIPDIDKLFALRIRFTPISSNSLYDVTNIQLKPGACERDTPRW